MARRALYAREADELLLAGFAEGLAPTLSRNAEATRVEAQVAASAHTATL